MTRNTCSVVNGDCLAPAGWRTGAGVAVNTESGCGSMRCYRCGESVCANCSALRPTKVWSRGRQVTRSVRVCDDCAG